MEKESEIFSPKGDSFRYALTISFLHKIHHINFFHTKNYFLTYCQTYKIRADIKNKQKLTIFVEKFAEILSLHDIFIYALVTIN